MANSREVELVDLSKNTDTSPLLQEESTHTTSIFIPLEFTKADIFSQNTIPNEQTVLYLQKNPACDFSYFKILYFQIANCINTLSASGKLQVGLTYKQAEAIVNQHRITNPYLIIEINIPTSRLEKELLSEHDAWKKSGAKTIWANASRVRFPVLLENTQVEPVNIMAIAPMNGYDTTMTPDAMKMIREQNQYWPNDLIENPVDLALINKLFRHQEIIKRVENELERLENSYFADEKVIALSDALDALDFDKIGNALAIRRFGFFDNLFGRKGPTQSQMQVAAGREEEFKALFNK